MASLLVRRLDKPATGKPHIDSQLTSVGDVIVVRSDGWVWSEKELTGPWVVIDVPNNPTALFNNLLLPQNQLIPYARARAFYLDIDSLSARQGQQLVRTYEDIKAATREHPYYPDPARL